MRDIRRIVPKKSIRRVIFKTVVSRKLCTFAPRFIKGEILMTRQFMFVGLLLLGGCMWAHAQTDGSGRIGQSVPMTVGQLSKR